MYFIKKLVYLIYVNKYSLNIYLSKYNLMNIGKIIILIHLISKKIF